MKASTFLLVTALLVALTAQEGVADAVSGDLFVSDGPSNAILEYNGTTGAFVKSFTGPIFPGPPSSLVFGPNGNLFVFTGGSVNEFNGTTGAFITSIAVSGLQTGGLVFGPNGNLFVTGNIGPGQSNEILEFNGTTLANPQVFVTPGSGGLSQATGLTFFVLTVAID